MGVHIFSKKHQQMTALHLDRENIFKPRLYINKVKVVRVSELEPSVKSEIQKKYPHLNYVSLADSGHLHGTQYTKDMILPAGVCGGLPEFHKILTILIETEKVTLICKRLSSWYHEHFQSYELVEPRYAKIILLDPDMVADYHPLASYTVGGKLLVITRTFILH